MQNLDTSRYYTNLIYQGRENEKPRTDRKTTNQ